MRVADQYGGDVDMRLRRLGIYYVYGGDDDNKGEAADSSQLLLLFKKILRVLYYYVEPNSENPLILFLIHLQNHLFWMNQNFLTNRLNEWNYVTCRKCHLNIYSSIFP